KPDLVITDVMMPKLTGFEVCRELQKNPQTQNVPVIFITATRTRACDIDEAAGICPPVIYILKPFSSSYIIEIVDSLLRNSSSMKQVGYSKPIEQLGLKKSVKLTEFGKLIGGIIHDLTNEFEVVKLTVNYLASNITKGNPNAKKITDKITQIANNCSKLLKNMLELVFQDKSEFSEINVLLKGRLGKSVVRIAHTLIKELEVIDKRVISLSSNIDKYSPDVKEISVIRRSTAYSKILLNNLLNVISQKKPDIVEVDVHKVLKEVLLLVNYRIPSNIELRESLQSPLSIVLANEDQLKQVFMNIITNAMQSMPQGGELKILTKVIEYAYGVRFVGIEFSDTGIGISEENLSKIFDLSFSTKRKGYGLGLYISRGIIHQYNGVVRVMSEEGKGTTFMIELPIKGSEMVCQIKH
ncbi:MAG: ATP-binding protein, partial [bacterium]